MLKKRFLDLFRIIDMQFTFTLLDYMGYNTQWARREAILRIHEAVQNGASPIDPDYAPPEIVEQMIPPPGDWEKIWLSRQPSTMTRGVAKWCW